MNASKTVQLLDNETIATTSLSVKMQKYMRKLGRKNVRIQKITLVWGKYVLYNDVLINSF